MSDPYRGHTGYSSGYGAPYNNTPSWGYIIFYLVVLLVGLVGNGIFCLIIKKNVQLRKSIHLFLLTLSIADMLVCVLVLPFIIDSQAKRSGQQMFQGLPEMLCKMYISLDYGLKGVQVYTLLVAACFLYFWYRKNESYATQTGEIVTRKTRMHKWGIPLACVVGIGVSLPAGTVATVNYNGECSAWHVDGAQMSGTNYNMNLSFLIANFLVPACLFVFPFLAIFMQICGARTPRLDPPHNRIALTIVLYIIVFVGCRAPHDIYELMQMLGRQYGNKGNQYRGMNPNMRILDDTKLILECLVYLPCLLHPIILIICNPDYRQGLKNVCSKLYCNQSSAPTGEEARRGSQIRFPQQNKPIIKQQHQLYQPQQYQQQPPRMGNRRRGEHALIAEVQPMIMPAQKPILNQMGKKIQYPGHYGAQPGSMYIPMETLSPRDPMLHNNSYEGEHSPQPCLPAEFEYGRFKYVDTARVEPKIAYTPTNTPPKTPQMPHFDKLPFKQPNYIDGTWILPEDMEAYRGLIPPSQIPIGGFPYTDPSIPSSPLPVEIDDPEDPMEIESLDHSPGSTLRTARRGVPEVTSLADSPGARRRASSRLEDAPARSTPTRLEQAPPRLNGHREDRGQVEDPYERPSSRNTVEITLSGSGRSRSRQDLCPDRPRSKFEHAV